MNIFLSFYFEVIFHLQKNYKNSWKSFHISLIQLFQMHFAQSHYQDQKELPWVEYY